MRRITLLFALLSLIVVFYSGNKVNGKGDVVSEMIDITGFTAISLSMDGDIYFTPDSVYSVENQAQQNILDVIETPVEGGKLVIGIQDHTVLGKHDQIRIYIHAPSINGLDVSGSGDVSIYAVKYLDVMILLSGARFSA
jgi:hypothetical protein